MRIDVPTINVWDEVDSHFNCSRLDVCKQRAQQRSPALLGDGQLLFRDLRGGRIGKDACNSNSSSNALSIFVFSVVNGE